mgnify:FL=1
MKERLDVLLVKRGLAPSREKAKTMIMEGNVFVNNNREDKAGSTFAEDAPIEIHGNTLKYVSRGGLKLEKAMTHFSISLDGMVCMDIGASTGGFTDCMLQNGAKKVYSVDVGYGQFAWKLRQDLRHQVNLYRLSDLHAGNCCIKSFDHHPCTAYKFQWLSSVIRGIKLCSIIKCAAIMCSAFLSNVLSFDGTAFCIFHMFSPVLLFIK